MPTTRAAAPARPPTVEVLAAPAAELLMTLAVVTDRPRTDYAVGPAWLGAVERDAGRTLIGRVRRFSGGSDMVWAHLLTLASESPPPRDVASFLHVVATTDPRELKLRLVGFYVRFFRRATPAETIAAAVDGDAAARRAFLRTSYPNAAAWQGALRHLLPLDPAALRDEAVELLAQWHERVFCAREPELMRAVHADAERLTAMARTHHDVDALLTAATGEECPLEPAMRHVVLVPSAVIRPVVHRFDHHDTKILVTPVDPGSTGRSADAPPDELVRTLRALGDARRLRILHHLGSGDLRLAELSRRTGMAATTLLHHLAILRAAGLVQPLPGERGYGLRPEPLHDLHGELNTWLGSDEGET
jgi:DNA-binding transcriptional ArsR family regulator